MLSRLSMKNLLAALIISAGVGFGASVGVTSIRQAGAPLDPSLRNEVEHAVDLATEWLAAHQNTDGSWGPATDRVTRTAVTLLALTARASRQSDACARAAVWLDGHCSATNELPVAYLWRMAALMSVAPNTPAKAALAARLQGETRRFAPGPKDDPIDQLLWRDALAMADLPQPRTAALDAPRLKAEAAGWPPPESRQPADLWPIAFLINRTANGALSRDGEPLDWRRDIAQILINTQRRDPSGGGFWGASESSDRVWQTAFGILTLGEL